MQATDKLVNTIIEAVDERQNKKAKSYDTSATVTRIEGSTAYVHIPGGVDETPAAMTIAANKGDTVQVRVGGGRAWLVGNASAPPTDDTKANAAEVTAGVASQMAGEAIESANIAAEAAESAQDSARRAETSANEAKESATQANIYANGALTSLADVEDVINVLDWIQQHGTYAVTSDETVVPGKFYFTRTGSGTAQDPYVYTVVDNPQGDPSAQGYYECTGVDEAITNFVTTHLSVTNQGLFVLNDNSGWKVLIKSDGVEIRDPQNATAATYGASTTVGYTASGHTVLSSNGMEILNGSTSLANIGSTIRLGESSSSTSRIELGSSGMDVYKGTAKVANFGDTATIGKTSGTNNNVELTSTGLMLKKGSSNYNGHLTFTSATTTQTTLNVGAGPGSSGFANIKCEFSPLNKSGEVEITGSYEKSATLVVHGTALGGTTYINANADKFELSLSTTATSGTDHDLYAAITALGWQSTVID